jgi:hypothetical protein
MHVAPMFMAGIRNPAQEETRNLKGQLNVRVTLRNA